VTVFKTSITSIFIKSTSSGLTKPGVSFILKPSLIFRTSINSEEGLVLLIKSLYASALAAKGSASQKGSRST
jgi:hypothetical protein